MNGYDQFWFKVQGLIAESDETFDVL